MARKVADCRDFPSEINCTLTISGEESEVIAAAAAHAVSAHGHEEGPELEREIRSMLKDEMPAPRAAEPRAARKAPSARH